MPTAINSRACKKYEAGTGLVDCELFFGEPSSFFLVRRGWTLNANTTTLDKEYIINAIQSGTFIPFQATRAFTENTPDPTRQDYSGGERRTIRNGNPDYTFEFDNGVGFHAAAYSYNGGSFDLINVDRSGNLQLQRSIDNTTLKGFRISDLNTRTYRQRSGDTAAGTMVEIQLADVEAFNKQMALISVETLGVNVNDEVRGVVSVNMKVVSADVSDGTVVVDVTAVNNNQTGIRALTVDQFDLFNVTSNALVAITSVDESLTIAGRYTITPTAMPAAGQVIKVQTDGFNVGQAARISGSAQLYKGESANFTVTA